MKHRSMTVITALLFVLTLGSAGAPPVTHAQTSPSHDLSWHVVAGGGREWMSSGVHQVHGTLGQLAIGSADTAGHTLTAGYWYGPGTAGCRIYLPLVSRDTGQGAAAPRRGRGDPLPGPSRGP